MLPQLDRFVDAVLRETVQDGGEAIVAGNSLGGLLSLRAAQRCDEVPLAGVMPIAPAGFDKGAWFRVLERIRALQVVLEAPAPVPEQVLRAVVGPVYRTIAFAHPAAIDPDVVDAFTSHHRERGAVARYLHTGRRLLPELEVAYKLDRVGCPVLLVWGDRDRMVTHAGIHPVVAALPDTEVVLLKGCGHCRRSRSTS